MIHKAFKYTNILTRRKFKETDLNSKKKKWYISINWEDR